MRRRRRASRRDWERDLLREIRTLDTSADGHDGPVVPIRGRVRRHRPRTRSTAVRRVDRQQEAERTRTLWTLVVTVVVVLVMLTLSLGPAAPAVRGLLGL